MAATDSDSDGSHISATPPRDLGPSLPPPTLLSSHKFRLSVSNPNSKPKPTSKPKPPLRDLHPSPPPTTLLSSHKFRPRVSSRSNPNSKPKPTSNPNHLKTKTKTKPSEEEPRLNPFPSADFSSLPGLSVQNCCHSDRNHAANSMENLRAGYFSMSASFTKIKRPSFNLDPLENEPVPPSVSTPQPDISGMDHLESAGNFDDSVPPETSSQAVYFGDSVKSTRKHPNLIGVNPHQMPSKRPKCVTEGNFVRLNINGYGRKFNNKCGRRRTWNSSRGQRSSWRNKRKFRAEGEGEINGLCEEEGLVSETSQQKQQKKKNSGKLKFDNESIEQAVSATRDEPSDENLIKLLKLTHGYDSFRDGQLQAIKQVIAGQSTMLVLPTGAGKSLCYQLPALILPGVTLVVSPLVALMVDQLRQLPPMIPGGFLCSSQTSEEVSETLRRLQEGNIKVLFVSPERFLNAEFISIFGATPRVSLVVVDEAHCLSEWSHNFRPSYLRLRASVLRTRLNVKCILAMTATATTKTLDTVLCALEIPRNNLIQAAQIRENLQLSVTLSGNRQVLFLMKDVMMLIKSSPFTEVQSIIIYCKFQYETDLLSKHLCDNNISAKSYHSGIPAKDRSRTQELFCSNKIRVVVATVAFGMGLDKSDVGAIIHYSLPESLEEYVQEIGRAGRDGRLSKCHLLIDDTTYFKLRSLLYSDGVDEYAVNRLLFQLFSTNMSSPGKSCSLVKESASRKFDMKEEFSWHISIYRKALLLVLSRAGDAHTSNTFRVGRSAIFALTSTAKRDLHFEFPQDFPSVACGQGYCGCSNSEDVSSLASLESTQALPQVLRFWALIDYDPLNDIFRSETKQGHYVFDIPTVANSIGLPTIGLSNQLQNLKSKGEITYELKDPAFCYTVVKQPGDFCSLAAHLTRWLSEVESCKVFLQSNSHAKFTPRAIARIMHGIASPAYPSAIWSKTHFWGRYLQIDFSVVMNAAKLELMNFVGKDVL
ncbi:hypothetical protein HHK36_015772 [Tetracentron sinense]|uniref:DNA 3'-5' helicase n=1 Tax=Tetracentron sinense TaxID=13715 RepID=A0A835DGJ2_TETSI|nr:hypothetical protein HHK36_015772 [Tetracentron sinense]